MNTQQHHHITSRTTYTVVYIVLLALLGATVTAWYLRLGFLGILLGDMVGVVKATIIMLYFMHVRQSSRLIQIFAAAAFVWLLILIIGVLQDYVSRSWLPVPGA